MRRNLLKSIYTAKPGIEKLRLVTGFALMIGLMSGLQISANGSNRGFTMDLHVLTASPYEHFQQQSEITGTVTDATTGEPIHGASIWIDGTTIGVITQANGEFSIETPESNAVLIISFIGYQSERVSIDGRSTIDVQLTADVTELDGVVVVGYGTQRAETLVGAVSTIKTAEITKNAVADITNSIAGRIPGVIAVQSGGEPGNDGAQLFIRGQASLNDNSPLVLVDGVEREFNRIDPNSIESMSVLKDASATAVYGVRGANGVILITTKRGKESPPVFTYSSYYGVQNPIRVPELLNAYDYATLYNEASMNDGADPLYTAEDLQKYRDHSDPYTHPAVDWNRERLRENAPIQRHSLSMSGGSSAFRYYVLYGLIDQKAVLPNWNYRNHDFRANLDANITQTTKLAITLAGSTGKRHMPGLSGDTPAFVATRPNLMPVKWENGLYASDVFGGNGVAQLLESGYRNLTTNSVQSTFVLDQDFGFITEGLGFKVLASFDNGMHKVKDWILPLPVYRKTETDYSLFEGLPPNLYENFAQERSTRFEAHLKYNKTFGRSEVSGLLLYTQSAWYFEGFSAKRNNYGSSAIDQLFAGPLLNLENDGSGAEGGSEGYVGRITYGFDSKYLAEMNFAYNGSENFPSNKRFGFFPSAAVGWVISREDFLSDVKSIDFLKIRASYGEVGNDRIGGRRFLYLQPFNYGDGYVLGGNSPVPVQAIYPGGLPNTNVTWERAKKTNIGLEAWLFDNMLELKADVFFERRDNILAYRNASVPDTFGAELPVENIAKVDNRGFEIELNHNNKIGDLEYSIGGNLTFARNEIVYIDEPVGVPEWQRQTGLPMGQFFGYVSEGLYLTQDQIDNNPQQVGIEPKLGQIMYRDINGDGVITSEDHTAIGHSRVPQIMYGINLGVQYKNFDFSALIQGAARSSLFITELGNREFYSGQNSLAMIKDRWTPDGSNPDASYPRLSLSDVNYKTTELSTFSIKDGAYWRLKNIELGYTLPTSLLTKMKLATLRVFVASTNLFTRAKFKDWDPEAPGGSGGDKPSYFPQTKVNNIGITATF